MTSDLRSRVDSSFLIVFLLCVFLSVDSGSAVVFDSLTVPGISAGLVASPGSTGVVSSIRPAFCCSGVRGSSVTGGGILWAGGPRGRLGAPAVAHPAAPGGRDGEHAGAG